MGEVRVGSRRAVGKPGMVNALITWWHDGGGWRTIIAFGLPLALYWVTLAPTVYNLDSAELTTAAATGGIVRATGYPLYLLIGRLWSLIPLGDVGYRMNFLSAVCGALTIVIAERILRRLKVGPWATLGALGLLATAPFFWALSLIAEVYTLHTALMALVVLLLLRWGDRPTPRRLALLGLVVGLSMAHHAASALLIPGILWYVLTVAPREALAPRSGSLATLAVLAGVGVYLYLPLRYEAMPAFNYAGTYDASGQFVPVNLQTPEGLWWLISGKAFAGQMLGYRGGALLPEVAQFGVHLWRAFLAVGIGPGIVGMAVTMRKNWRLGGLLLVTFVLNAAFYITYRVVDKETMFLPTYVIWALWAGVGYQWLLDWSAESGAPQVLRVQLPQALIAGSVIVAAGWNWHVSDLSDDWSARTRGERIMRAVEPNALVLGWWDTVPVVEYLQLVEGHRPDIQAINRFLIPQSAMERLVLHEVERRPVYIDDVPTALLSRVETEAAGPLVRLYPRQRSDSLRPAGSGRGPVSGALAKDAVIPYDRRSGGPLTRSDRQDPAITLRFPNPGLSASQSGPADLPASGSPVLSLDL